MKLKNKGIDVLFNILQKKLQYTENWICESMFCKQGSEIYDI